MLSHRYVVMT